MALEGVVATGFLLRNRELADGVCSRQEFWLSGPIRLESEISTSQEELSWNGKSLLKLFVAAGLITPATPELLRGSGWSDEQTLR